MRFGSIEPDEDGNTARRQVSFQYKLRPNAQSELNAMGYLAAYRLNLFSNFTLFLTRYEFTDWFAADLDLTFTKSGFKANAGNGNGLALAPTQTWAGGLSARHTLGAGVARGGLRFYGIGDRPASDDGKLIAPGITQVDLHLGYRYERFDIAFDVENLLNGVYRSAQFDTTARLRSEPGIGDALPSGFTCGKNGRLAHAPGGGPANGRSYGCEDVDYTPALSVDPSHARYVVPGLNVPVIALPEFARVAFLSPMMEPVGTTLFGSVDGTPHAPSASVASNSPPHASTASLWPTLRAMAASGMQLAAPDAAPDGAATAPCGAQPGSPAPQRLPIATSLLHAASQHVARVSCLTSIAIPSVPLQPMSGGALRLFCERLRHTPR